MQTKSCAAAVSKLLLVFKEQCFKFTASQEWREVKENSEMGSLRLTLRG
jgi:hypothetical protein